MLAVNSYVAALYDKQWYMGKILEYDQSDNEHFISFMVEGKKSFKWPSKPDTVRGTEDDILISVHDPVNVSKTRNMYRFREDELKKVEKLFK